eukprot:2841090-Ditylum_brightwellii.AAC.1
MKAQHSKQEGPVSDTEPDTGANNNNNQQQEEIPGGGTTILVQQHLHRKAASLWQLPLTSKTATISCCHFDS